MTIPVSTDHPMSYLAPVGAATICQVTPYHSPQPLRFVWHHVLPKACGGPTTAANLVSLCDSCHYAVHALMTDLKRNSGKFSVPSRLRNRRRSALALSGYMQARANGTLDNLPNEGGD